MEIKNNTKIMVVLVVAACWAILLSGLIRVHLIGWLILIGITSIVYLALTKRLSFRKRKLWDVVDDLEEHTKNRAKDMEIPEIKEKVEELEEETEDENSSKSSLEQSSSDEEKYDFGDDVKIIKK